MQYSKFGNNQPKSVSDLKVSSRIGMLIFYTPALLVAVIALGLFSDEMNLRCPRVHLTWHHAAAPLEWWTDPIVAVVGHRVVVAGGTCDFELLAVEIYDIQSRTWSTYESMPLVLKDSVWSVLGFAEKFLLRLLLSTLKFLGFLRKLNCHRNSIFFNLKLKIDPEGFACVIEKMPQIISLN